MKINYEKIKGRAIIPRDHYNTHVLLLNFVYDGKLPITKEHIYSGNRVLYDHWCNFANKIRNSQDQFKEDFAIVLDSELSEGCIYGDVNILRELGYEPISLTDSLDELPNMFGILGVTPNQTLEECGLIEKDMYSPHRVTLDGVIRAHNNGCLEVSDVLDLFRKVGYITDDENKLYELFNLSSNDFFKISGRTYDGFSSENNLSELMQACETNTGLIYDLINNPREIVKIETLEEPSTKKVL